MLKNSCKQRREFLPKGLEVEPGENYIFYLQIFAAHRNDNFLRKTFLIIEVITLVHCRKFGRYRKI